MVHSVSVIILALAASSAVGTGYGFSEASILSGLFAGVALIGLPHGGLDHQVGTSLFSTVFRSGLQSRFLFFGSYLSVAAVVIAGWCIAPWLTVALFFAMSAWHFGLEEEDFRSELKWFEHLGVAVRGGAVIWCTCAFRPREVTALLEIISPLQDSFAGSIVSCLRIAAPLFVVLLAGDFYRCCRHGTTLSSWLHAFRLGGFVLMFATCPVLLSFAVYFCGWHSIRGLIHLRKDFQGSDLKFLQSLFPMSLLAIGFFATGLFFLQSQLTLSDAAIRTMFIGLSAVAVPHLLLHVVSDSFEGRGSKVGSNSEAIACPT